MKKSIALICIVCLVGCTSKKSTVKTPGGVTEAQFQTAKIKFADVTMDQLKIGHSTYNGACTNCHGLKDIKSRDEQDWSGILDRMALKANLTPTEKDAVWRYIMAVKLSSNS
jgi:hypothetical protein